MFSYCFQIFLSLLVFDELAKSNSQMIEISTEECGVRNLSCLNSSNTAQLALFPATNHTNSSISCHVSDLLNQNFLTFPSEKELFTNDSFLCKVLFSLNCCNVETEHFSCVFECQIPKKLFVTSTTSTTISLEWSSPDETASLYLVKSYAVYWAESVFDNTWVKSLSLTSKSSSDTITDLKPDTGYEFYLEIIYTEEFAKYINEKIAVSNTVVAKTMIDTPPSPENVKISNRKLIWDAISVNERNSILNYTVEYRNRSAPDSAHVVYGNWMVLDAGATNLMDRNRNISSLPVAQWYEFRIYASNEIGRGDSSLKTSPYYLEPKGPSLIENNDVAIGVSVSTALLLIIALFIALRIYCKQRLRKKQIKKNLPTLKLQVDYGNDIELASIRHMTSLAMTSSNQGDPVSLPMNYRDQLTLLTRDKLVLGKQLGKGAFGEVYSGKALVCNDIGVEVEVAVAVKTLKQTASDSEKVEFLMESYLMSFFDHPNIISSIGVCLDNEPQFLVLELMEGGDLRTYIKEARPSEFLQPYLTIIDILEMSLDVAAGCRYLESKHFIHRDLAARNCLVSTKSYDTYERNVKIGDFGLARDLHDSDYYLKEGQGLVPVRWMAPESISHQKYSFKSDVWSFGVLLWEMITFGERPYAVYNNEEVVDFIMSGERLKMPENCPDQLYDLMKKCWRLETDSRPSFENIYNSLQQLRDVIACNYFFTGINTESDSSVFVDKIVSNQDGTRINLAFNFDEELTSRSSSNASSFKPVNIISLQEAKQQDQQQETIPKSLTGNVDYTTVQCMPTDNNLSRNTSENISENQTGNELLNEANIPDRYVKSPSRLKSIDELTISSVKESIDTRSDSFRQRRI